MLRGIRTRLKKAPFHGAPNYLTYTRQIVIACGCCNVLIYCICKWNRAGVLSISSIGDERILMEGVAKGTNERDRVSSSS